MSDSEPSKSRGRLLVVDDEPAQRQMLSAILERAGFTIACAANGQEAVEQLESQEFDLLLTDQRMPVMDGLQLLEQARRTRPGLPVVLMTAYGTVSTAVEAMKRGAANYLTKPFERDELLLVLDGVLRRRRLEDEVVALRGALQDRYRLDNIIGSAPSMQQVFSIIERVAYADVPVLITGESGTGKELVARAIHENSNRAQGPFVALNCAAVPEALMESEFFGHERGAFTGATGPHAGRFEQANRGTLFLDEIGAMRFDLQAKLLRALQEHEVQRLGSATSIKVDVRILAATCDDLDQSIRERSFREDLYYRLNVVPVHMPALRDRVEDIPLLADHLLAKICGKLGREVPTISPEVMDRLQRASWPGNVRELENCIERMVVLARGGRLTLEDLPPGVRDGVEAAGDGTRSFDLPPDGVRLTELERHLIRQAMQRTRGSLGQASRLLGISYKTLQYRLRKHGLDREEFGAAGGEAGD